MLGLGRLGYAHSRRTGQLQDECRQNDVTEMPHSRHTHKLSVQLLATERNRDVNV
jgi:hypothetical protein